MLGLKLPTDPRWVNIVEGNISEILTDHAYCEQKACTNAINIIIHFPECTDLVDAMLELSSKFQEGGIVSRFANHQFMIKLFEVFVINIFRKDFKSFTASCFH